MRVLILDLLTERLEFGHGGNVEMITPLASGQKSLDVMLLTPQYQRPEAFVRAGLGPESLCADKGSLPKWDDAVEFHSAQVESIAGCEVRWRRMLCPAGEPEQIRSWIGQQRLDAVYCSGSRHNVSLWEEWMGPAADLLLAAHQQAVPTLAICFGHQLLAQAFGARIERAEARVDAVHDLQLTPAGAADPLFAGLAEEESGPIALFTHQDQVRELPTKAGSLILLAGAPHNRNVAIRVLDESGFPARTWGVQFHPEASQARIERSLTLGHISSREMEAFQREHDGERILANFAAVVRDR